MIGKLITALFNFILTMIMTIVQLICLPLNALFNGIFPDFSNWLNSVQPTLQTAFGSLAWAVSIIPPTVREVIILILTIEIALIPILRSTHITSKVWNILQKLKFW